MPIKASFANSVRLLEAAMSIAEKRHSIISSNVSNVDTPGYRGKDLDFKATLDRAILSDGGMRMERTHAGHIDVGSDDLGRWNISDDGGEWNGINWIDLDSEIAKLTENNLIYRGSVETLLRRFATLKEVIREGGR